MKHLQKGMHLVEVLVVAAILFTLGGAVFYNLTTPLGEKMQRECMAQDELTLNQCADTVEYLMERGETTSEDYEDVYDILLRETLEEKTRQLEQMLGNKDN